ncbi:SWAP (Suppressor-of-White-APricot)/surp RNA-binding domain-containing protein [Wolffia australiana]
MDRHPALDYASAMAQAQHLHHHHHHQQQQQQQPPPFAFHPPQYPPSQPIPPFLNPPLHPSFPHYPSFHPSLPPQPIPSLHVHPSLLPHPVPPPADPDLHKCIDKLAEYVSKNGPEFEAMIREKQHDNPIYAFLFGGEGHGYYRYRLWLSSRGPIGQPFNSQFNSSVLMNIPPQIHNTQVVNQPYLDQAPQFGLISSFKGVGVALPPELAAELGGVLGGLTGTKESIKGAKNWFVQRSQFAPALAEALKERMFFLDDSERQMHIIFLANDILFDSLQRRQVPQEVDSVAQAFKPVLGSMLGRIYNNPQNRESNQSRLEKILQFWASKEVFDQDSIRSLEDEMTRGLSSYQPSSAEPSSALPLEPSAAGLLRGPPSTTEEPTKILPLQLHPSAHLLPALQQPPPPEKAVAAAPPPYPLFPPGLIPGMVKKMQVGSGVPYSPISPLDIPTVIPPPTSSPSEIVDRVARFFKEIGEVNPKDGDGGGGGSDEYGDWEQSSRPRVGGACIPPPSALLQGDTEFTEERRGGGGGRPGLGAAAEPGEVSQYDDVYSSYRKQRSSSYHTSMSARSSVR